MAWNEKPDYAIVCATPDVTEEVMTDLLEDFLTGYSLMLLENMNEDLSQQWLRCRS